MEGVVEATRETFRSLVSEGTVLVDVWGPDCRPCLALMPHVERRHHELFKRRHPVDGGSQFHRSAR